MSVKFSDHVAGVSTFGETKPVKIGGEPRKVPSSIRVILAKADVQVPAAGHIPLGVIDKILIGKSISERIRIKSILKQHNLID